MRCDIYKFKVFLLIFCVLQACALPQATPYQKAKFSGSTIGGYGEQRLPGDDTKYHVYFNGNSETKAESAIEYWFRRSKELCPNGFEIERLSTETASAIANNNEAYTFIFEGVSVEVPVNYSKEYKNPNVYGEIECN